MTNQLKKRLVVIGIGGASCSGKTLLAKHIRRALPEGSNIPEDRVPYSAQYPELQDWDDPETCIMWPEFRSILSQIHQKGQHDAHASHDHLNKQVEVGIRSDIFARCTERFRSYIQEQKDLGIELVWYIVDGFVLYWDKTRREERQVYVLQHGSVWVDPPNYFEKIVWPGYVKAHSQIFDGVETGPVKEEWGPKGKGLHLVEPKDGEEGMTSAFEQTCDAIMEQCQNGAGRVMSA
ncbi:uncharacterized protein I206_106114 [Kwoniella pini CBS 10737]|uniref:Nicotinamide riboside kinase n=1 Tax=Kwoniella pini CBS 10737 TaxID=1296096 RepID=A0AAJ8MSE0_9TREE